MREEEVSRLVLIPEFATFLNVPCVVLRGGVAWGAERGGEGNRDRALVVRWSSCVCVCVGCRVPCSKEQSI